VTRSGLRVRVRPKAKLPGHSGLLRAALCGAVAAYSAGCGDALAPHETKRKATLISAERSPLAVDRATDVAAGKVRSVRSSSQGPNGESGIHTRITLDVYRTLVGTETTRLSFWIPGGRVENRLRRLSHQPRFVKGEEVVMLLRTDPSGFLWPTGQHPKWNLDRSQADWRVVDGNDRHESDTSASAAGMPFEALLSSVGSQRGDP
jgi:hypothetical protein